MLNPRQRLAGFTLIELVVTITVFSILVLTAAPALTSWVANSQVRTVADGLQNGLHLAQAEASRRNRQVQFILTSGDPSGAGPWTPTASGKNWVIVTVPKTLMVDASGNAEAAERVQGSSLANVASLVAITGPATLIFNSFGIVSGGAGTSTYSVSRVSADHPLNVTVSTGGQIRVCDSTKAIADSAEGC